MGGEGEGLLCLLDSFKGLCGLMVHLNFKPAFFKHTNRLKY